MTRARGHDSAMPCWARHCAGAASRLLTLPASSQTQKQAPKIGDPPEALNMRLVGHNDLQARTAYQPTIFKQGGRYIAYVGHHGAQQGQSGAAQPAQRPEGAQRHLDPRRDRSEESEISRAYSGRRRRRRGRRLADDARVRRQDAAARAIPTGSICCARSAARATRSTTSPIPSKPKVVWRHLGMTDTHKNYWECETGIAYLVSRPEGLARAHRRGVRPERSRQSR